MNEWWEQPIEVTQDEQEQNGVTRRRVRMKALNWTVDAFPLGKSWSTSEPTIVIDQWLTNDAFNTRVLVRMLKDALNYCDWGGIVEPPTANEIVAAATRADDV